MKIKHLSRYREILMLFWRYGHSDLVRQLDEDFEPEKESGSDAGKGDNAPEQLANDLEAMGPTFIKLGQVLAGRPDLLPAPYVKALARLQDKVKPFPFEEVEAAVTEELGVRLSKAFARFDEEPLAAASLGQVHAAALRDGREVVVKVQRPGIRATIAEDFEVLAEIAEFMDTHTEMGQRFRFGSILAEFRETIKRELNYEMEAQNLRAVGANLQEFPHIFVPAPITDYCSRAVLTMERVSGSKVTEIGPLASLEYDAAPIVEELFKSYLQQVLVDGLFHADPHPGNIFVTLDGQLALLDLGMVGYVSPGMQTSLLKILMAVSEGQGERAADIVIGMSTKRKGADVGDFRREVSKLVARQQDQNLDDLNVGQSLLDLSSLARTSGLIVPSELTVLGKALMQLDEVGKRLDPEFNPSASIRRHVDDLMSEQMKRNLATGNVFGTLLEAKEFMTQLPARLNRIMDVVTNSELQVKVKALDANTALDGMQKIANRITMGMVLSALIMAASLMMRVDTDFQLFGYPGLAILCFLAAAAGGFYLVFSIFIQDYRSRKDLEE
ncbi:ABC1 kinase family protein [Synoicihabitans lomoniglobus]|uniref:AarF/UbiB family protein n=1 Tax=Synoicihabitans lomoniglobus TaxID=2909285 RepID=A0AAE9ZYK1_9BACT|nr:AarF/UbiB family protein [Opitutaceae bacterium LMO-M01]WED65425.1 AarF/UbiB family protein [Opitutaceae bacterium LMO-M01]